MKKEEYTQLTRDGMYSEGHVNDLIHYIQTETNSNEKDLDFDKIRKMIFMMSGSPQQVEILYQHYINSFSLSNIARSQGKSIYDVCKSHERALKRICKTYSKYILEG